MQATEMVNIAFAVGTLLAPISQPSHVPGQLRAWPVALAMRGCSGRPRLLKVSASGFYAWQKRAPSRRALKNAVSVTLHLELSHLAAQADEFITFGARQ